MRKNVSQVIVTIDILYTIKKTSHFRKQQIIFCTNEKTKAQLYRLYI